MVRLGQIHHGQHFTPQIAETSERLRHAFDHFEQRLQAGPPLFFFRINLRGTEKIARSRRRL